VDPKGGSYRLLSELSFTKALDKALKEDLGRLKDLLESRPVPPRQRPTIRGSSVRKTGPLRAIIPAVL